MPDTYSTYDAKARLSEILRKVRSGKTVLISHRGDVVAEVRPVVAEVDLEERLDELARRGALVRQTPQPDTIGPTKKKPGALKRFLEDRDA